MTVSIPALSARGITKRFGDVVALDTATLEVGQGTLHALLGENGAGKTTLMRLIFGMTRADAGEVRLGGIVRHWRSSADAIAAGIGMVHQHFMLIPAMTVAENVALGDSARPLTFDPRHVAERVLSLGSRTGLVLDPTARVADLPVGAQQRLEIVKALARDARFLILDEPTAVLTPPEAQELYRWLRRFVEGGRTAVLITHKLREALAVADDITVLRKGRTVLSGSAETLSERQVVDALLGGTGRRELPLRESPVRSLRSEGSTVAVLEHVSALDTHGIEKLHDICLDVRAGEILGIAGVEGAGQLELMRILAGRQRPASGTIVLPTRVGFVPEDRLRDALIAPMTLTENFALKEAGTRRGRMPWPEFRSRTEATVQRQEVGTLGPDVAIATLSGGNQQKFVLGRELEGAPQLLVVENPVRGLDIRATAQVIDALRSARTAGVAIAMYASDTDELLEVADRIVVCFSGRVIPVASDATSIARALVGAE